MDFSIVNNLSHDKVYEKMDEQKIREYNPFLVNRAFSHFADSVLQANFLNKHPFLPKQTQFDYLFYSLRKRKRFTKWPKKMKMDIIPFIMTYYNCSKKEAEMYESLLSSSDKKELMNIYGGANKT